MFLKMSGRRVVIVGGGEHAAQKARLILKTKARIEVIAEELEAELEALETSGKIHRHTPLIPVALFTNTALVFVATGCPGADSAWHALAHEAGALINVVDQPDLCDAMTPSIVDRDPVVVAIGTEGTAPILARQIKTRVEELLEPRLGDLAALAGRLRTSVKRRVHASERRSFWRWVFSGEPRRLFRSGAEREATRLIKTRISESRPPAPPTGFVSLVGAGPGAQDLITLRGVQRLQEADLIFYDGPVDLAVLELARRDAERIHIGKTPGTAAWPQEKITALISAAAKQGKQIVWLKVNDPESAETMATEVAALLTEQIDHEVVPGIEATPTAATSRGQLPTKQRKRSTLVS